MDSDARGGGGSTTALPECFYGELKGIICAQGNGTRLCCLHVWMFWIYTIWAASSQNPTKWPLCPAKTLINPGIRPVWSMSSLSTSSVGPLTTYWVHSEGSDQTGRMPRLIWVFAGRTYNFVGFVTWRLIWKSKIKNYILETVKRIFK